MSRVKIVFVGRLADVAGRRETELDLPPPLQDVLALRTWLGGNSPALAEALADPAVRILVNAALAPGNPPVCDGDEIAFLPIMSGG